MNLLNQYNQALVGLAATALMLTMGGVVAPEAPVSAHVALDTIKACTPTEHEEPAPDQTYPCRVDTRGRGTDGPRWIVFYSGPDAGCPVVTGPSVRCVDVVS